MIMLANPPKTEDNTWYVGIFIGAGNEYYSFTGAGGRSYKNFKAHTKRHGINIVAEQFEIDDVVINHLTGFCPDGRKNGRELLSELVNRLNAGESLDPQKELEKLCKEANKTG